MLDIAETLELTQRRLTILPAFYGLRKSVSHIPYPPAFPPSQLHSPDNMIVGSIVHAHSASEKVGTRKTNLVEKPEQCD